MIGYSASECPKCVEEHQALMLYNQEQAKLSFEREEALKKEREAHEKEKLRRIEHARLEHEQWKKSSYPKLKRISVVAVMCLIIGIAGICLSTENFIAHDVNAVPYSSTSYVPPVIPSPTPTPTPITTPSPITILNDNNVNINLVYENNQGISIAPSYFYETEGVQETFVVSIFLGGTIDSNDSNLLWTDGNSYNGFSKSDVISFSRLNSSDSYCVVISFIIPDGGALPLSYTAFNASFTINYIPTSAQLDILVNGTSAPPQPTPQPTGTYVTHTTILNETYSFNQAMSKVSASAIGIIEILLIVIGALILVAIPIVVYSKSCYELE